MCRIYGTYWKGGEKMDRYTPEQARKLRNISQVKMAALMGMAENTYINKEKGETKFYIDEACKFCEVVEMPLERIIFFKHMCHKNGTSNKIKGGVMVKSNDFTQTSFEDN